MQTLKGKRIAILATDGFEETELTSPVKEFREAGAEVDIIAPHRGGIQGFHHMDRAATVPVDKTLDEVDASQYDALHLPGGALSADALRTLPDVKQFVMAFDKADKPISAICHAPWILISAGVVAGRTLTSYHTIQDDLKNAGADWTDSQVVENENWVTSRQPDDLPAFNTAAIKLFSRTGQAKAA